MESYRLTSTDLTYSLTTHDHKRTIDVLVTYIALMNLF